MFAKERRDEICLMLKKDHAVTASKLVERFGVSIETIRKDLLMLEQAGRLVRVHGGAVAQNDMTPFFELKQRNQMCVEEKRALSLKATEFICEGDVIAVDTGSTAILFAEALKQRFRRLTVVTWSRDVVDILCDHEDFELILCGGYYMRKENAFCGAFALDMLRNLYVQKTFLFPTAVSVEFGICGFESDLHQLQMQLLISSDEIYILADSSKFEKRALFKLSDINDRYYYVTDSLLSAEMENLYKENHLKIFKGENKK